MARGLYLSRSILGNTQWDGANSACNRETLLVAFRCCSCWCCLLLQNPLLLLCCSILQLCDCDANHTIRHSSLFLVFSFIPLSYQIFWWISVIFFLEFSGHNFRFVLSEFCFSFCLISAAYLLRGVGVQICLLFVRSSFFLGFVHTLQSPLSLLITSETCCETRKLLLCFAFFLSLFRRVEVAVVDLFHLLLFRRCFCHLNAWIFEYLAEGFVLAPLAVHKHTRKNSYHRS